MISAGGAPGLAFSYSPEGARFNPLTLTSGNWPSSPDEVDIDAQTASKKNFRVGRGGRGHRARARAALPDRRDGQVRRRLLARRRDDLDLHPRRGPAALPQAGPVRPDQRRRQIRHVPRPARRRDQAPARPERSGQDRSGPGPAGDQGHERLPQHLPGLPARVRRHRAVRGQLRDRQHAVDHDRPADA